MLPTRVGMNRQFVRHHVGNVYAPHASGDEPLLIQLIDWFSKCSPREWG